MDKRKVIIVDESDNIIAHKYRGEFDSTKELFRVSALWIINSKNKILLAKRSINKKHHPGKWGPAASGTNDEGETYLSNIIKETKEEIGLDIEEPTPLKKVVSKSVYKHFTQWYLLRVDVEINQLVMQEEEVEDLMWIDKEKLKKELKENPDKYLKSINEDFLFEL